MKSFLSLAFTVIVFYACSHSQESYVNDGVELGKLVDSLSIEPNEIYIHIDKSDYRLSVMVDSLVFATRPSAEDYYLKVGTGEGYWAELHKEFLGYSIMQASTVDLTMSVV